ncbi:unnamed protein product [Phytophthora fragariaefolia]|uniref:Unnamed protein product n=1 Tax=Phytophthora fragariaefolia TaxID=1490495 RepID=A0A9W7D9L8_9STRA|nr:unnamed protein product [Phytophthora fragariaefolia]
MAHIEQSVARHLDQTKPLFDDEQLDTDQQYNMDESQFVIDFEDGKNVDFRCADKDISALPELWDTQSSDTSRY